jgi:MFS family permease
MTSTSQALKPRFGRSFQLLWAGQSASLIGDQITLIALPLVAVTFAHATPAGVGLLGACLRIPFLLVGLQAGVWVVRIGLAPSMLAADIVRGLAIALVVIAVGVGAADLWLLVIAVSAVGVATVFFQVSYQSFVPEIVPQEDLWHGANTRLTLSESLSLLIGPAVGGLVIGLLTLRGALVLDVMTYAASVISLALIVVRRASNRTGEPATNARVATRRAVWEGMRYVSRSPVLRAIMWTGAAYNLGAAMFETLLVLFGIQTLHAGPAEVGLAIGIGGIGFPLGSLLSSRFNSRVGMGPALIWAAIPSVAGILVSALAFGRPALAIVAAGVFIVGIGQGCFGVNAVTLRQRYSSPEMRARATAVHRFVSWGALPGGALLGGFVGQVAGLRSALVCASVIASLCFIPLLCSPLRSTTR